MTNSVKTMADHDSRAPVRLRLSGDDARVLIEVWDADRRPPEDPGSDGLPDVEAEGGVAYRGSFLIDKSGVVQHQVVNNLPLGRNIDEMLRMVDALQFTEEHGEVCPAGWNKGKAGMKPSTSGVAEYLATHAKQL